MATPIETAGLHAAAVTSVIGLGVLITKPIRNWRQRRKAERKMILDALKETGEKLDSIKDQMTEETMENREVHGRIEEKVDGLARHTRVVMTSTVAIIDALMQHDKEINGVVKEYRKMLTDALVDGI